MSHFWVVTFRSISDTFPHPMRSFEVEADTPKEARAKVLDRIIKQDQVTSEKTLRQEIEWGNIHGPYNRSK